MKYTPEIVKEIAKYIEQGATQKDACTLAGISDCTSHEWKNDPKKPEFSETLKSAEARCKQRHIMNVQRAGFGVKDKDGNWVRPPVWQASSWYLERRYREEYALRHELVGADGETPQFIIEVVDPKDKKLLKEGEENKGEVTEGEIIDCESTTGESRTEEGDTT